MKKILYDMTFKDDLLYIRGEEYEILKGRWGIRGERCGLIPARVENIDGNDDCILSTTKKRCLEKFILMYEQNLLNMNYKIIVGIKEKHLEGNKRKAEEFLKIAKTLYINMFNS